MGFWVLAACSIAAWALIAWKVHEPSPTAREGPRESLGRAVVTFVSLFRLPYTPGIIALSFVCYASFITLRGLWLGPMMIERHGFSLVQSGTVALAVSLVSLLSPSVFGRLDPGVSKRRRWLIGCTLISATLFAALALFGHAVADIALTLGIGMLSGYMVMQYAQVRSAYPERIVDRALALFTMSMFLGVAVMQWFTGLIASTAKSQGAEIFAPVLLTISALLVIGALAFAWLPQAPAEETTSRTPPNV